MRQVDGLGYRKVRILLKSCLGLNVEKRCHVMRRYKNRPDDIFSQPLLKGLRVIPVDLLHDDLGPVDLGAHPGVLKRKQGFDA